MIDPVPELVGDEVIDIELVPERLCDKVIDPVLEPVGDDEMDIELVPVPVLE